MLPAYPGPSQFKRLICPAFGIIYYIPPQVRSKAQGAFSQHPSSTFAQFPSTAHLTRAIVSILTAFLEENGPGTFFWPTLS